MKDTDVREFQSNSREIHSGQQKDPLFKSYSPIEEREGSSQE